MKPPIEEFERRIVHWGIDRNILGETGEGTPQGQLRKTLEEVVELVEAVTSGNWEDTRADIQDAIGDIVVTLIMQAEMWDLKLRDCLEAAWNQIKDRKGRMSGGVFVKE